jgi:hypothetical protein
MKLQTLLRKGVPMKDVNWKAIGLGALDILLLIILSLWLARSVAHQFWIAAQICLLGILSLLVVTTWQIRRLLLGRSEQKPPWYSEDLGIATCRRLMQFASCGVAAIIIYAIQYNHWKSAAVAKIASVGLLTAGASLAAGAVLGFIFGVPRSQRRPSTTAAGTSATGSAGSTDSDAQFGANTNLEQISDWFTKTIVGVGLVELSKLPPLLDKLAWYVAGGMGDPNPHAKAVALVVIVYFVSTGFLISYLWTRWELTGMSRLSKRVRDLEQSAADAEAVTSVDTWLRNHPAKQDEDKARSQMMNAIKSSSSPTKARVFVAASDYMRSVPAAKSEIERASDLVLPIFQALVEADGERIFHRNRGQYAFSLMTQPTPDWQNALKMLQEAIAIRDRSKEPGWPEYEFARAICRIKLDPQAKSKPEVKSAIDADLRKAAELRLEMDKRDRLDLDKEVEKWQENP